MTKCIICGLVELNAARRIALKALCQAVVGDPRYKKRDVTGDGKDETFCNVAVRRIADGVGCRDFKHGPLANDICDILDKKWRKVDMAHALEHAFHGGLAIAGRRAQPHGHVAVVYPEPMQLSPSLAENVVLVANVGKENRIGKVTEFFAVKEGLPDFWIWSATR